MYSVSLSLLYLFSLSLSLSPSLSSLSLSAMYHCRYYAQNYLWTKSSSLDTSGPVFLLESLLCHSHQIGKHPPNANRVFPLSKQARGCGETGLHAHTTRSKLHSYLVVYTSTIMVLWSLAHDDVTCGACTTLNTWYYHYYAILMS